MLKNLKLMDKYSITCADTQSFISDSTQKGITIRHVEYTKTLTICFYANVKYRGILKSLAEKHNASVKIETGLDIEKILFFLKKRAVLLLGIFTLIVLNLILPQRILFVEITGNQNTPENLIREKAAICGIDFWTLRRNIRSESVKNALLSALPQLQWVGINTRGCVATISVAERSDLPKNDHHFGISNVVASRDGIIKDCTVVRGRMLCEVGQAVTEGQILVSGYIDSGLLVRGVYASAEITARTNRKLTAISLNSNIRRAEFTRNETRYSIIIGKKLINLFKDSGILDSTCVKINKIYPLTLPGGLVLPISLLSQQVHYYDYATVSADTQEQTDWIEERASSYLRSVMNAGTIIQSMSEIYNNEGVQYYIGNYFCEEIISKTVIEEKLYNYVEDR